MKKLMRCFWILALLFTAHCSFAAVTTDNIKYSASTAITITLNSLAASATVGRQATPIDNGNGANLYDDVFVTIISSMSNSALSSSKVVNVYIAMSEDGTNYDSDDAAIGASDAGYTINAATNLRQAVQLNALTSGKSYTRTFSVAALNGGVMPRKWVPVVCNDTGQSLASAGNSMSYTGITYTNQ